MKRILAGTFFIGLVTLLLALPILATPRTASAAGFPYWGPLISCTGNVPDKTGIPNPIGPNGQPLPHCESICDLLVTLQNIFFFMLTLALVVFAPLAVLAGALLMITSAGSEERVTQGRNIIKNAVIGIALVLGTFVIMNTFMFFLSKITTPGKLPSKWNAITCSPKTGITIPK